MCAAALPPRNPLAFSTLACPEWPRAEVVRRAAEYGYDAIEWRGGPEGHVPPTLPLAECEALGRQVAEAGLFSLAVTAYTSFTSPSADERAAHVADLQRHIEAAAALGARFVRVFLGELPPDTTTEAALPGIAASLETAAAQAVSAGVCLAIEPHDDFVRSADVLPVLNALPHPAVRVIWDVGNAFAAGELPAETWPRLAPRLAYVQVKDGTHQGGAWRLTRLGEGDVPLALALRLLRTGPAPFDGAVSLEWERPWHPYLDPAEAALPAARRTLEQLLAAAAAPAG